jgi:hypothetical protein
MPQDRLVANRGNWGILRRAGRWLLLAAWVASSENIAEQMGPAHPATIAARWPAGLGCLMGTRGTVR